MSSNPFKPTTRGNPCPLCGDTTRRCRSKVTEFDLPNNAIKEAVQFFCINHRGDVPGFKYSGETDGYRWGKYITQELSKELSDAWREHARQQPNNQLICKAKSKPKSGLNKRLANPIKQDNQLHLLDLQARNREIRKLLAQLELKPSHWWALRRRGFSSVEIKHYQFKSLDCRQPLELPISNCLAGIATDSLSMNNNYSGLLIPIRNSKNQYLGWQVRLDFNSDTRYLWPVSDNSSVHVAEYGKLPLGFFLPVGEVKSNYIGLVEGVGFKGIHTSNRYRQIVIGASSGQFVSSPQQLKAYLEQASAITQKKLIVLYADAGAVLNRLVLIQYQRTVSLVVQYGYQVRVAWWGQIFKIQGDIDEYHRGFELISVREFFQIAKKFIKYTTIDNNENSNKPQRTINRS